MQPVFPFAFSGKASTNHAEKKTEARALVDCQLSFSVAI